MGVRDGHAAQGERPYVANVPGSCDAQAAVVEAPVARADDMGGLPAEEDVDRLRRAVRKPPATQLR